MHLYHAFYASSSQPLQLSPAVFERRVFFPQLDRSWVYILWFCVFHSQTLCELQNSLLPLSDTCSSVSEVVLSVTTRFRVLKDRSFSAVDSGLACRIFTSIRISEWFSFQRLFWAFISEQSWEKVTHVPMRTKSDTQSLYDSHCRGSFSNCTMGSNFCSSFDFMVPYHSPRIFISLSPNFFSCSWNFFCLVWGSLLGNISRSKILKAFATSVVFSSNLISMPRANESWNSAPCYRKIASTQFCVASAIRTGVNSDFKILQKRTTNRIQ